MPKTPAELGIDASRLDAQVLAALNLIVLPEPNLLCALGRAMRGLRPQAAVRLEFLADFVQSAMHTIENVRELMR